MTDTITLTGLVATVPKQSMSGAGVPITSFRLASTQRRYDRAKGQWVDGETNWYSVAAFRQLATNAAQSVEKGDRVIVTGRVRLRDWSTTEKSGTSVDIEADALGHDLAWGTARWVRTSAASASASASTSHPAQAGDSFAAPEGPAPAPASGGEDTAPASDEHSLVGASDFSGYGGGADDTPF